LRDVSRRKSVRTTRRDEQRRPAPDLVETDFTAAGLDRLWGLHLVAQAAGNGDRAALL